MPTPSQITHAQRHHRHHDDKTDKNARTTKKVATEQSPTTVINKEFDDLAAKMITFPEAYEIRRKEMDGQRFFNRFRAETNTPARRAAAEFVKTMAELIQSKRSIIESQNPSLLYNALLGVLLVQLMKIKQSYDEAYTVTKLMTSIKSSALASIILDVLKVDGFDKIEPTKFNDTLKALKKCLAIIDTDKALDNEDIIALVGDIDKFLEPARIAEHEATPAPAMS